MRHWIIYTLAIGLGAAPLVARAAAPASEASDAAGDRRTPNERIRGALALPLKAQELRKAGAGEAEVKAGLKAAKGKKLRAEDAAVLLEEAAKATREHGPVDNFGAFVQAKLDAGLRGRDLATAIREEHAAHGKGKGKSEGKGPPDGKGPPEGKGPPDAKSGPDDAHHEGKGPPDGKGPDDKGPEGKGHEGHEGHEGKAPDDKGPEGKGPEGKGAEGKAPDGKGAEGKAPEDKKPADAKGGKPEDKGKPDAKGQ